MRHAHLYVTPISRSSLLRADAAARRRHEIDCVEPQLERSSRVLEYRSLHRMLMMTAIWHA